MEKHGWDWTCEISEMPQTCARWSVTGRFKTLQFEAGNSLPSPGDGSPCGASWLGFLHSSKPRLLVIEPILKSAENYWQKWAARKLCCDRQVARTVWGRGTFQPDEGSFKRNPWRKMEDMSFWNGSSPKWWYVNWSKSTCILFISKYCIDTYARYRYVVFSRCVPYSKLALTPALYVGAEQQL